MTTNYNLLPKYRGHDTRCPKCGWSILFNKYKSEQNLLEVTCSGCKYVWLARPMDAS